MLLILFNNFYVCFVRNDLNKLHINGEEKYAPYFRYEKFTNGGNKMAVIKNLWNMTKFYCGHGHEIPVEMIFKNGTTLFYSCPRYYVDNINRPGERSCTNRLSFDDAEQIILKISDKILEYENRGEKADITNYSFKYRNIEVKVLKYTEMEMRVQILNKTSVK